jgi:hypothetical protein
VRIFDATGKAARSLVEDWDNLATPERPPVQ